MLWSTKSIYFGVSLLASLISAASSDNTTAPQTPLVLEAGKSTLVVEWNVHAFDQDPEHEPAAVNIDLVQEQGSALVYVDQLFAAVPFRQASQNWEVAEDSVTGSNFRVHVWSYLDTIKGYEADDYRFVRYRGNNADRGLGLSRVFSIVPSSSSADYGVPDDSYYPVDGQNGTTATLVVAPTPTSVATPPTTVPEVVNAEESHHHHHHNGTRTETEHHTATRDHHHTRTEDNDRHTPTPTPTSIHHENKGEGANAQADQAPDQKSAATVSTPANLIYYMIPTFALVFVTLFL